MTRQQGRHGPTGTQPRDEDRAALAPLQHNQLPAPRLTPVPAPHKPPRRRPNLLLWLILAGVGAEIAAPLPYKPSEVAGSGAGRFYGHIMAADNDKQVELAEQYFIAETLAEREAEYGAWLGRCAVVEMVHAQFGPMCRQGAEDFYQEAIREARQALTRIQERTR